MPALPTRSEPPASPLSSGESCSHEQKRGSKPTSRQEFVSRVAAASGAEHAAAVGIKVTGNASGIEPILFFNGTPAAVTPEPSAGVMTVMALGTAFVLRRRLRRAAAQNGGADRQRNRSWLPVAIKRMVRWTLLLLLTTTGCGSSAPSTYEGKRELERMLDDAGLELVSFSKEDGQASVKDGVSHYRMHISARVRSKTGISEILSGEKNERITGWLDFDKRESGWQLSDSNWN